MTRKQKKKKKKREKNFKFVGKIFPKWKNTKIKSEKKKYKNEKKKKKNIEFLRLEF